MLTQSEFTLTFYDSLAPLSEFTLRCNDSILYHSGVALHVNGLLLTIKRTDMLKDDFILTISEFHYNVLRLPFCN